MCVCVCVLELILCAKKDSPNARPPRTVGSGMEWNGRDETNFIALRGKDFIESIAVNLMLYGLVAGKWGRLRKERAAESIWIICRQSEYRKRFIVAKLNRNAITKRLAPGMMDL